MKEKTLEKIWEYGEIVLMAAVIMALGILLIK